MYYIIETHEKGKSRTFSITTEPYKDMLGVILHGELASPRGYQYAHGEYDTLEKARKMVISLSGGKHRKVEARGEHEVECYEARVT